MAMRKGTQNYAGIIFGMVLKLAQPISWCSAQVSVAHKLARAKISRPDLIPEVSPCNVGVPFVVGLLPSCHSKGNLTLGAFRHLGKAPIMPNLAN